MATHSSILAWKIPCAEEPGVHEAAESQTLLSQPAIHDSIQTEMLLCLLTLFYLQNNSSVYTFGLSTVLHQLNVTHSGSSSDIQLVTFFILFFLINYRSPLFPSKKGKLRSCLKQEKLWISFHWSVELRVQEGFQNGLAKMKCDFETVSLNVCSHALVVIPFLQPCSVHILSGSPSSGHTGR